MAGKEALGKSPQQATTIKKDAKSNSQTRSKVTVECKVLTVNVFFDGTGNNFYNIDARKKNPNKYKLFEKKSSHASYFDAYSNIAHLFKCRPGKKNDISWVYIDGIGTTRLQEDDKTGKGFGAGETGIHARVDSAFDAIRQQVLTDHMENYCPSLLKLNVFGFSRGAAAARHFVRMAKFEAKARFKDWNLNNSLVSVQFVGLFDTVSSFHPRMSIGPDFDNDTTDTGKNKLYLKFGQNYASHIFHITAADEYRRNFSLTDITSAIELGNGFEVAMSGAHSDIGGSYPDKLDEYYNANSKDGRLKDWFLEKQFYTSADIIRYTAPVRFDSEDGTHTTRASLEVRRKALSNVYHKIPFKTMRVMAEQFGFNLKFDANKLKDTEEVPAEHKIILRLRDELSARILSKAKNTLQKDKKWGMKEDYRLERTHPSEAKGTRYRYIHWSAKSVQQELGMDIDLENSSIPKRKVHKG